ncbi:MAG: glycoside hydrolase family 92 protein, partial [Maribacter sp.]|nr:glycoside hydrolase family 92 protein [Maribacter sp.]
MIFARIIVPIAVFLLISSCTPNEVAKKQKGPIDYVDPFIGTGGHGHTYPGATAPFGRVQPSPDNGTAGWDWCSGYHTSDSIISGFGQLHLSGTGIGDLSDILLMPTNSKMDLGLFGKTRDSLPYTSKFSHAQEFASPGFYEVLLEQPNISVELTANDYVAYHRYSYKEGENPSFVIDLGYAVNWDKPLQGNLKLEDAYHIVGHRYSTGWAKNQKVFFAIESSSPIVNQQLIGDESIVKDQIEVNGAQSGGQFFFEKDLKSVLVKIAVSSVSIENAKENLKHQGGPTFEETRNKTADSWNTVLSSISIETPIDSLKTIFYTALYHTQVAPTLFNDVNGEFRLQNDSIARKDFKVYSTLSLWDVFRTETPLLSIIDP